MDIPTTISKTIDVLSAKFGSTGIQLWNILVQRTRIDAIIGMTFGILLQIILIPFFKYGNRLRKEGDDACVFVYIGWLIVFAVSLGFVFSNIEGIILPQYAVLQSFISK